MKLSESELLQVEALTSRGEAERRAFGIGPLADFQVPLCYADLAALRRAQLKTVGG